MKKSEKLEISDVLEAISEFSTRVDQGIDGVEQKMGSMENRLAVIETDVSKIKGTIATQMVTKDYLDNKLAQSEARIKLKNQRVFNA